MSAVTVHSSSKTSSSFFSTIAESRPIKAISRLAQKILSAFTAALDFVLPRNVVTGKRQLHLLPTRVEKWIGKACYTPLIAQIGVVKETDLLYGHYVRMVKKVGAELAAKSPRKGLEYEFNVVNSEKDNAFCLPGGKIAINLGLLKNMDRERANFGVGRFSLEEKIAAVLSHEITHASARHGGRRIEFSLLFVLVLKIAQFALSRFILQRNQRKERMSPHERRKLVQDISYLSNKLTKWTLSLLTLCKSRYHEFEADKYGMHLMRAVGKTINENQFTPTSPRVAIWLQHYFKAKHPPTEISWLGRIRDFFATHPSSEDRIKANEKTWRELQQDNNRAAPAA